MIEDKIPSGDWLKKLIKRFMHNSALNTIHDGTGEPAWDDVLVGFSSGADYLWQQYKEFVGAFHWTPWEIYNQYHPELPAKPEELTVISWALPQREFVRRANRKAITYPAQEWARIRVYGEKFNVALRNYLLEYLENIGYAAVAPILNPNWTILKSNQFSYASSWSERHAAHACGLGTFGLCDGLITAKGKAMRVGSIVAKISIQPTPRPYNHHQAYCLFFNNGTCGQCIDRCPVRAITESGHDKEKCRQHLMRTKEYVQKSYGFEGYGCGLCQVAVPCESTIPVKEAREAYERGEIPTPLSLLA